MHKGINSTLDEGQTPVVTHTLRGEGFDASEDGTPLVPVSALAFQERGRSDGRSLEINGDLAYALTAPSGGGRGQERNVAVSYTTKLHNTASNQAGKVYDGYCTSLDANSPPPAVFAPVTQFGETAGTLTARHDSSPCADRGMNVVAVSYAIQAGALRTNPDSGPDGVGVQADHAYTLEARAEVQCVAAPVGVTIHGTDPTVRKVASYDDLAQCLRARTPGNIDNSSTTVVAQPIAFHPTQDPISSTDGTTHGLGCGSSGGQASVAVAVSLRGREGGATAELGDEVQNCLRASQGGGDKPHVLAPVAHSVRLANTSSNGWGIQEEVTHTLDCTAGPAVQHAMQVRRLTPRECERLQGFPDDYTAIPWRKKPASECPDGPRYKALGNSWAVPNVRWIGQRIEQSLAIKEAA